MKVLFQTGILCYRGSTVAIEDYARYNQTLLGNESVICYPRNNSEHNPEVIADMEKEFHLIPYDNITELEQILEQEKIDLLYNGETYYPTNGCPKVLHEAWQKPSPPNLSAFAYISEWLANTMNQQHQTNHPYIPHIVKLPEPTGDLKEELSIPSGKTVIGRIGGKFEFNVSCARQAVEEAIKQRDDIIFVFAGTQPFGNHPNIRFIPSFHDLQRKANFINTCDAMIHGRLQGETFGLAIAEFLSMNKPVLAWEGGTDKNHTWMLRDSGLIYNSENVLEKILNIRDYITAEDWSLRTQEFKPEAVMPRFKEVLLTK